MIRNFIIAVFSICYFTAAGQDKAPNRADRLNITFNIITNNYQNKPQSRSSLLFTVTNNHRLPVKGWKLYFNFARQIIPSSVSGDVQIRHLNGDFFCLSPSQQFKGITSGDTLAVEFTSTDWLVNITDAPGGFYLVYDDAPGKTYPIDKISVKASTSMQQYMRSPLDKVDIATPASIFAQNKDVTDLPADGLIKVFPSPVSYHKLTGNFILRAGIKIRSPLCFKNEEKYLRQTLAGMLNSSSTVNGSSQVIKLQYQSMTAEAYELTINRNQIIIAASTGAGIFYGIQSLKMLISPQAYQHKQQSIAINNVVVKDEPRFGYRALMLDVARNFQSKMEILKLLDVMSLYKMNVLHFHLTDDEGWRIEIPGLPELAAIGGKRGHTLTNQQCLQPAIGSGADIHNAYGSGYYSKPDFIEILRYATQRHIRVIPEIESPGHARAAIKAMDARYARFKKLGQMDEAEKYLLHDWSDTSHYISVQYWNDNVVDVAMPSTYRFINTVTDALIQMYREAKAPFETIHFGGDEVPTGAWQGSLAFRQLMKTDTSIRSPDDLWLYYYNRVDHILKSHQLYLTAWEETGLVKAMQGGKKVNVLNTGLLNRDVHLEVWNNVLGWGAEDLAYKQANAGYKVILSCVSNLYFDMASEKSFQEPGYYWGGYVDVDKLFKFIPYNYFKNTTEDRMGNPLNQNYLHTKEQLTETGKANIIGLQGALWSETVKGPQKLEYMLLPKLLGLAERAWAANPDWATGTDSLKASELYKLAWCKFVNILGKRELPRLDYYAGGFNYRIPEPGAMVANHNVVMNSQLPGFKIYYTTDGSNPTTRSYLYTKPVMLTFPVKVALFNHVNRSGRVVVLNNQ